MYFASSIEPDQDDSPLEGKFLVAMPHMQDENFQRAVVFMCAHSSRSAMGIVVNNRAEDVNFETLLSQIRLSETEMPIEPVASHIPIVNGGPVERRRGFVLHSAEFYIEESTLTVDGTISLTSTVEVLRALAVGDGPSSALVALGCAGWGPGQLDREIQGHGWLVSDADPRVMFERPAHTLYPYMLRRLGVEPGAMVSYAGTA